MYIIPIESRLLAVAYRGVTLVRVWQADAWYAEREGELSSPRGRGETVDAAICDLLEKLDDS